MFHKREKEKLEEERKEGKKNERSANQPESIANQQEVILKLNFSKRDHLVLTLNQLASILQIDKSILEDAKQETCKKIEETIQSLVKLSTSAPILSTDQQAPYGEFEKMIFGQLVVELTLEDRSRVINQLIAFKDTLLFDGSIAGEAKRRALLIENRQIINRLLDLPLLQELPCLPCLSCRKTAKNKPNNNAKNYQKFKPQNDYDRGLVMALCLYLLICSLFLFFYLKVINIL